MSGVLEVLRLMGTMKLQNIWSSVWLFFPFSLIFPLLQVKAVLKTRWRGKILRTTSNFFCANSFSRGLMNGLGRGAAFRRYLLLIQLIRRSVISPPICRMWAWCRVKWDFLAATLLLSGWASDLYFISTEKKF